MIPRSPTLQAGLQVDAYTLRRMLGQGGMGQVYLAERHGSSDGQSLVAIKFLLTQELEAVLRFEREAQLTAAADNHPNIVAVYGTGRYQGRPYLVLQYIKGLDLKQLLLEKQRLDLDEALRIAEGVARALASLAKQSIIHRDLKTANILIRGHDQRPMITDFGLARGQDVESLTRSGQMMGTPATMAPEQIDTSLGEFGCHTDLWALACVLYEMLAGQKPFDARDPRATMVAILSADYRPLKELRPDIPAHLSLLLEQTLVVDPKRRRADPLQWAEDCAEIREHGKLARYSRLSSLRKNSALIAALLFFLAASSFLAWSRFQVWQKQQGFLTQQSAFEKQYQDFAKDWASQLQGYLLGALNNPQCRLETPSEDTELSEALAFPEQLTKKYSADWLKDQPSWTEIRQRVQHLERFQTMLQCPPRANSKLSPKTKKMRPEAMLTELCLALKSEQWPRAESVIRSIEQSHPKAFKEELLIAQLLIARRKSQEKQVFEVFDQWRDSSSNKNYSEARRIDWVSRMIFEELRKDPQSLRLVPLLKRMASPWSEDSVAGHWRTFEGQLKAFLVKLRDQEIDDKRGAVLVRLHELESQWDSFRVPRLDSDGYLAAAEKYKRDVYYQEKNKQSGNDIPEMRALLYYHRARMRNPELNIPKGYRIETLFGRMHVRMDVVLSELIKRLDFILEANQEGLLGEGFRDGELRVLLSSGEFLKRLKSHPQHTFLGLWYSRIRPFAVAQYHAKMGRSQDYTREIIERMIGFCERVIKRKDIEAHFRAFAGLNKARHARYLMLIALQENRPKDAEAWRQKVVAALKVERSVNPEPHIVQILEAQLIPDAHAGQKIKLLKKAASTVQRIHSATLQRRLAEGRPAGCPLFPVLDKNRDNYLADIYMIQGTMHQRLEQYEKAKDCYKDCLKARPRDPDPVAFHRLASMHFVLKEYDAFEKIVRRFTKSKPSALWADHQLRLKALMKKRQSGK